jgi:hypothetical protein
VVGVGDFIERLATDVEDDLRPILPMVSEVTELALEDDFFENNPILRALVVLFIKLAVGYRCRHETDIMVELAN